MDGDGPLGTYGFRLVPESGAEALPDLSPVPSDAPEVRVTWRTASALHSGEEVHDDHVWLSLRRYGTLDIRREPAHITGSLPEGATPAALVHPLLTLPLALLAHWRGRATVHAGAFVSDGRAWIVTGDKEAGKSTLLAALGRRVPIVADDLVVIDGDEVLTGPACVDLRPDTASRFDGATSLGEIAGRQRHRLRTRRAAGGAHRLGGVFVLGWDDERLRLARADVATQLAVLHAQHYGALLGPPHPEAVMTLLGVPMWHLRRPRRWGSLDETVDLVLETAQAAAPERNA